MLGPYADLIHRFIDVTPFKGVIRTDGSTDEPKVEAASSACDALFLYTRVDLGTGRS